MISLSSHRGYSSCTDSGNVHINAHSAALFVGLLLSEKYIIQFNSDGNINTILFPIYFSFTTIKNVFKQYRYTYLWRKHHELSDSGSDDETT